MLKGLWASRSVATTVKIIARLATGLSKVVRQGRDE